MKPMTLKRLDAYSKLGGCIVCGSFSVEFCSLEADGPWVHQHASCNDCGAKWADNYMFWGIDQIRGSDTEEYYLPGWQSIIEDILKHKETLPVLLGINKELDAMINAVLSEGTIDNIIL